MNIPTLSASIFVIHFILLLLSSYRSRAMEASSDITADQHALLALKAHITHDPNNILSNWSTSTSICNWVGVTCSKRDRRVIALDLSGTELQGTIPPHLGNLAFLSRISIYGNKFSGSLPKELAKLYRIRSLNFSSNYLSGEIPTWIGSFTELQELSLSDNKFTGLIPTSICNLSNLATLQLSANRLSGSIPENIGRLDSLKFLHLHNNSLSGSIPSGIFNISLLEEVRLRSNFLSGSFPMPTLNMTSLRLLGFTFNNLTGAISTKFFSYFPNLEGLFISDNMLSGPIPSSLMLCSRLQILSLSYNKFDGKIPKEIGNLTLLQELYLGFNNFNGADIPSSIGDLSQLNTLIIPRSSLMGSIPSVLGNLTLLQYVDLSENNLRGKIPVETSHLVNLVMLSFDVNNINGSIPSGIFNNSNLEILSLTSNQLSGELPASVGLHLSNLTDFVIAGNGLTGPLPSYISNASKLETIDFGYNAFSGPIPHGFGNLRYLQILSLAYNNLTSKSLSSILSSLTSCKGLMVLQLSGNQLEGDLPSTIGNFSSLQQFAASSCNIKGFIPHQIGNLTSLILLGLSYNQITSPLPTTIGDLHKLQRLDISFTKLQGILPPKLCNLQQLAYLSLRGNYLYGPLPSCLGNMVALRSLFLGSNNFSSSIPSSLWRLSDVLEVDLSSNSLTGTLLPAVGNMKALVSLDLSANKLLGNIPSNIGSLGNLVNLSLAGNNFEGRIPESFSDMISLEFLDLSINNLSGELPRSLENISHLSYFNVSYNNLDGEIPRNGPFRNFSFQSFVGNKGLCGPAPLATQRCKNTPKHVTALKLEYVLLIAIGSMILALAVVINFIRFRLKNVKLTTQQHNDLPTLATMKLVSIHELTVATNGFDEANIVGIGSFGYVYKGTFVDGGDVAVKVFNLQQQEAYKSFEFECEVLRNIRHRNLVKVITGCCNTDFKALVLEFMPNGSLDKWLYSHNYFLSILQRLNILIDVASALDYLHHELDTPVVHCDLKPSNILLDLEMVAHVGDFGIAKLLGEGNEVEQTMTLATIGYMAPEYGSEGIVSIRCDVYSYGIILIETFTRKKPTDDMFTGELSMKDWIEVALSSEQVRQVVDANLLRIDQHDVKVKLECAKSILSLALRCCAKLLEERIDISDALNSIKKIKAKFLIDVRRTT